MENKNQHWIPASYLKAWVDHTLPTGRKGQVWVHAKDGRSCETKSPKSVFNEPDFYTKEGQNGSRDLTLENSLCTIENDFITLRRKKLDSLKDLIFEDIINIVIFISIMLHRTKLRRDHEKRQWGHALKIMDDMAERIKKNPSQSFIPPQSFNSGSSMSHEDVKKVASEPIQSVLLTASRATVDILIKMNMHVVCAPENSSFITSDHPCVIFDPLYSSKHIALGCPSIEITFPLSPKKMVIFFWGDRSKEPEYAYMKAEADVVDEFNRRTRFFCDEYFVATAS